jgi:hypothetical protein
LRLLHFLRGSAGGYSYIPALAQRGCPVLSCSAVATENPVVFFIASIAWSVSPSEPIGPQYHESFRLTPAGVVEFCLAAFTWGLLTAKVLDGVDVVRPYYSFVP